MSPPLRGQSDRLAPRCPQRRRESAATKLDQDAASSATGTAIPQRLPDAWVSRGSSSTAGPGGPGKTGSAATPTATSTTGTRSGNLDPTQAHVDHVHLELNRPGAAKRTSFWRSPLAPSVKARALAATAALAALVVILPGPSPAKMRSVELSRFVCQTTGGGDFVKIPGFPGEKIDQRLLNDIKFLRRKYKIFITDGASDDPRPLRQRRASARPGAGHRPELRRGRHLGRHRRARPPRRAASRIDPDLAVPLGRLRRRLGPRPRPPPSPLLQPLRDEAVPAGQDRLLAALPGFRRQR